MKKQLVASLAAAMILGVAGTSFAASNPFVDVPAKHWSYDSVTKLAQAGVIDGYGDGTFKGDKTVTRYEMAQMVAKAMGNEEKATAAQKAEIKKLQAEYSDELDKLGVRLTAVEKNQANLKFTGNLLLRYNTKDYPDADAKTDGAAAYYRLRLDGNAKVDENTTFNFRYVTSDPMKAVPGTGKAALSKYNLPGVTGSTSKFGTEGTDNNYAGFDRYSITSKIGVVTATAGRQALVVGTTSGIVDSGAYSFDGLKIAVPMGQVNAVINHGRLLESKDLDTIELSTKTGKLNYGVGYFKLQDNANGVVAYNGTTSLGEDMERLLYGNATYNFNSKFSMAAEFGQNKADYADDSNKFGYLSATYGDQVLNAKGKNNVKLQYWVIGKNAIALDASGKGLTTYDTTTFGTSGDKITGWDLGYNYAFSKNLSSEVHYVRVTNNDVDDLNNYNYFRLNVVAKF